MMKPEDVAGFLKEHPEVFEQYAELLAEIYIPHPHGGARSRSASARS